MHFDSLHFIPPHFPHPPESPAAYPAAAVAWAQGGVFLLHTSRVTCRVGLDGKSAPAALPAYVSADGENVITGASSLNATGRFRAGARGEIKPVLGRERMQARLGRRVAPPQAEQICEL